MKGAGEIVKVIKDIILTLLHASPFIAGKNNISTNWQPVVYVGSVSAICYTTFVPVRFALYEEEKNKVKKEVESFIEERILREIYEMKLYGRSAS